MTTISSSTTDLVAAKLGRSVNKRLFTRVVAGFALGIALLLTGCENTTSDPNSPPAPSQEQDDYVPMPMPLPGGPPGVFIFI